MKFKEILSSIKDLEQIGEGWRGKVYKGYLDGKLLSFKVALSHIHKYPIQKEAHILGIVNKFGIGNQLRFYGEDFISYDFIDGKHLNEVLNDENYWKIIDNLLEQAYVLDTLKIDKGEMHKPYTNVLIDRDLNVYLIDFERAKKSLNPKNVLNLVQFIKRGFPHTEDLIEILKEYKYNQNEENFIKLKDYLFSIFKVS